MKRTEDGVVELGGTMGFWKQKTAIKGATGGGYALPMSSHVMAVKQEHWQAKALASGTRHRKDSLSRYRCVLRAVCWACVGSALLLGSLSIAPCLFAADGPEVFSETSTLNLANGDYVAGMLVGCSENGSVGWKSSAFTATLQFPLSKVSSVHFAPPAALPKPEGTYGMELNGGDLLYGSLVSLDDQSAELDVPGLGGRIRIDRSNIMRLYRLGNGREQLFVGPVGLNGWSVEGEPRAWREASGHLATNKPDSTLKRKFALPERVRFEIALSWKTQPDFDLAIAVGESPESVAQGFHIEVWDNQLVLQRQTEKEADLAPLQKVNGAKGGQLHVQIFLDQPQGRMLVFTSDGKKMADLSVKSNKRAVLGGIQLKNRKGDIQLERLQIGNWNGEPPQDMGKDKSRIHATDGTMVYGQLKSFDAAKREFLVGTDEESHPISEDKIQDLFLSTPFDIPLSELKAICFSGLKISGDYIKVEEEKVWLKSPAIQEPISISLSLLQSLVVLKSDSESTLDLPGRKGRLEINGMTLHGCLVDGKVSDTVGLCWLPFQSSKSIPFQKGVSGKIVYRDPPPIKQVTTEDDLPQGRNVAVRQQPAVVRARANAVARANQTRKGSKAENAVLHLRTGDTIRCEATSIDENGLTFKSSDSNSTFISNSQIQALELLPNVGRKEIDPNKKSRLLTVPRMQRTNPPTHLIRSAEGDYLRGRLISMDPEEIQIELRLEVKTIHRDKVARILWLHPETLEAVEKPKADENSTQANLVQALRSEGNRLTFVPEQVEANVLSGKSEWLGFCPVDLQTIDQLFMGRAIDQATADLPFQWKLKKSADPLEPKEGADGSGEGTEGMESSLVGKPAPEIDLKALDGTAFQLSSYQGKIVILDFWASWCGPCLQVMPQVDRVAHEFADQGVVLFAINLEETPEKVKAALERLKLSTTVVLDKDGRVAERYGATSIPQTVIIGRDGKVARLYVGGSPRFDEQLRTALKAVLTSESPKSE